MLPENEIDRIAVVLARARNPNNIGAVARAMYGFGFHDLRVVSDYPVPLEEARSAVDASSLLAEAKTFANVAEAITGCTLVVGTTAGGKRAHDHPLYAVTEGSRLVRGHLATAGSRVALLFGSEKTGLSREELSHCHLTMSIPMRERNGVRRPSMNLGQAAAVCLYELVREAAPPKTTPVSTATAGESERLTALVWELLEESRYFERHPAHNDIAWMRRLVFRMQASAADTAAWMGILRQALWKMRSEKS